MKNYFIINHTADIMRMCFKPRLILLVIIAVSLSSCKSAKISRHINKTLNAEFFEHQFTGVLVLNPRKHDTVFSHNATRYFTPASNAKIVTLYTALQYLSDSIPAFKYAVSGDTLIVRGTGDPSFLHPYFKDSTALKFMQHYKAVKIITDNYVNEKFGPGWAWEDFDTYFSAERSAFPLYGNVITISNNDGLKTYPQVLEEKTTYALKKNRRDFNANNFYYKLTDKDTVEVPLVLDSMLTKQLWADLLPNKVTFVPHSNLKTDQIVYSIPSDSLYKRMMEVSDNFLSEQLLILAASTVSDTLNADVIRKSMLENQLKDLKQMPKWVDGSGLSRYNLFTPLSLVQILEKLYNDLPQERLFHLFPKGGANGTLKDYYGSEEGPYMYAKSGSFGNNYCLSGYLKTKSGEVLIFSFMNNHFMESSAKVKEQMQMIFEYLRDNY